MSHLVLYDGVCGLCDRFVQFLLRRDRRNQFRFAALQGPIGTEILARYRRSANPLATVAVIDEYEGRGERLLERSDAALFAIQSLGGLYRGAAAFRLIPRFLRDAAYDFIARWRYRIFGRFDSCPAPSAATRAKFLDFPAPKARADSP